jgi:hypothetical protein
VKTSNLIYFSVCPLGFGYRKRREGKNKGIKEEKGMRGEKEINK